MALNYAEGEHGRPDVIEIKLWLDPFASIVKAIPLVLDQTLAHLVAEVI